MNEEILLFLERLEEAKQELNNLLATGSLLDNLNKVDTITFGDTGVKLNRKENEELFKKVTSIVIESYKQNFEETRRKVTEILDGKI
jgi:muramoyltetrapeptide carboxypeptidase LdcA involved in peptidoglycan recycling